MHTIHGLILLVIGMLVVGAPVLDLFHGLSWYDQQRMVQILVGALCAVSLLVALAGRQSFPRWPVGIKLSLAVLLLLGCISSLLSAYPAWALTEVALWVALVGILGWSGWMSHLHPHRAMPVLVGVVTVVTGVLAVQFLATTTSAFVFQARLHPEALLKGFSNERWAGQLQTLSLPLLVLPIWWLRHRGARRVAMAVLVIWWLATLAGGTRGTWLGLAVVMLLGLAAGGIARRWSYCQLMALLPALVLYGVIFVWLADLRGITGGGEDIVRTDSSGRIDLWFYAWQRIQEHPWFGLGPMHFAAAYGQRLGHPHNALIQIAYEWGLPAMFLVLGMTIWLLVHSVRRLAPLNQYGTPADRQSAGPVVLFAALLACSVHAQFSGVLVMPYIQLWLFLVGGCFWGTLASGSGVPRPGSRFAGAVLVATASLWLMVVAVRDYSGLSDHSFRPGRGSDPPRFWRQGSIMQLDDVERRSR